MLQIKNKATIIGSCMLVLLLGYHINYQFQKYKKEQAYRRHLAHELERGLRFIDGWMIEHADTTEQKVTKLFNRLLETYDSHDEVLLLNLKTDIQNAFFSYVKASGLQNDAWLAANQSGVLSEFSFYELSLLNEAYGEYSQLLKLQDKMMEFGLHTPVFESLFSKQTTRAEIQEVQRKYENLFILNKASLENVHWRYKQALEMLEPENPYLLTDSLAVE